MTRGHPGDMSPATAIAIVCQGAAILAGATPVEAARVWEIVGPMDVPKVPGEFAVIVWAALQAVRGGQGQDGGMPPVPVGAWYRGPDGSVFLRTGRHDPAAGIVLGWHRRGWGGIDGDPPGFPVGYEQIGLPDAIGS